MNRRTSWLAAAAAVFALSAAPLVQAQEATQPAVAAFDQLKAMAGDWIDVDGSMGMKDQVAVSYRVTGGGSSVIETLFGGTPKEMTTVYHKDGRHIALTHYCAAGNQPRMRATTTDGKSLVFDFEGGGNLDPSKDGHMHAGRIDFLAADRVKAQWIGWNNGKPSAQPMTFNLARKKA